MSRAAKFKATSPLTEASPPNYEGKVALALARSIPGKRARVGAVLRCLPKLNSQSRCADLGTSHGGQMSYIAQRGKWIFIDSNPRHIEVARTILKGDFFVGDINSYLTKTRGLSLITCLAMVNYFRDYRKLLENLHSALNPGAHLVISTVKHLPSDRLIKIRQRLGVEQGLGHAVNLQPEKLRGVVTEAGFEIINEFFYFGVFSMLLQTAIDAINLGPGKKGNRLTKEIRMPAGKYRWFVILNGIQIRSNGNCSWVGYPLSLSFLAMGYILVARKK